ncbi:protocatechuate 4,5-dioxygenase-like protein [Trypanosoma theileri]|uniref:Protocatechuate 4,5-dioxygenase-like protein n=1 Tax=Trypanosoma theileri TaxID=67003 RepID=A0A1X0P9E0_9TRYP|nr:protocatechuate 4,5-dioxygenase-like protein [Trypanosoma theileri]ORC93070.1 protocatechuate 4,5-dioxygenase-like protein [Trypanosoma theileri]
MVLYPALFVTHGGGPLPLLGDAGHLSLVEALKKNRKYLESHFGLPKTIAVISAHYETPSLRVGGATQPKMLYDYYGFPSESYEIQYPAPGEPHLAKDIVDALKGEGISAEVDVKRPFDHGVFVPLMIMFPEAKIPVVSVSVVKGGDPEKHIKIGKALRSFRSRGILFLGSGATMHNFSNFNKQNAGKTFGDALTSVLCAGENVMSTEERLEKMINVSKMNGFDEAQPRGALEHLMPLLTIVGTANGTRGEEVANVFTDRVNVRNYIFPN